MTTPRFTLDLSHHLDPDLATAWERPCANTRCAGWVARWTEDDRFDSFGDEPVLCERCQRVTRSAAAMAVVR